MLHRNLPVLSSSHIPVAKQPRRGIHALQIDQARPTRRKLSRRAVIPLDDRGERSRWTKGHSLQVSPGSTPLSSRGHPDGESTEFLLWPTPGKSMPTGSTGAQEGIVNTTSSNFLTFSRSFLGGYDEQTVFGSNPGACAALLLRFAP